MSQFFALLVLVAVCTATPQIPSRKQAPQPCRPPQCNPKASYYYPPGYEYGYGYGYENPAYTPYGYHYGWKPTTTTTSTTPAPSKDSRGYYGGTGYYGPYTQPYTYNNRNTYPYNYQPTYGGYGQPDYYGTGYYGTGYYGYNTPTNYAPASRKYYYTH